MKIESYSFGSIVINGETYTKDVVILPGLVFSPWWRKEGHLLHMEDLTVALKERPDILVIGKGYNGAMGVPEGLMNELRKMGIEVISDNTKTAVEVFNRYRDYKKVIAALHLTC